MLQQLPTSPPLRHQIAGVPIYMSRYGEAIRERREWVGFSTATDCARASEQLALDEPTKFKKFSQSSLSRWELDKTGQFIQGAHGMSLRTLAYLLKWNSDEFEQHVGVPVGKVPYLDDSHEQRNDVGVDELRVVGGLVKVPVFGIANGGRPRDYGVLLVKPSMVRGDNTKAFQVEGDSMTLGDTSGIRDGDWVLVDLSMTEPVNGKVFLLEIIGDGMTVKRLRNVEGAWVFMSDNPEAGESWRDDQVRIVGRVYGRVDFEEIH
ncbi:MAG: S24 family peptidase [Trueperaceae bacterium]